jgi:hypothetical protein
VRNRSDPSYIIPPGRERFGVVVLIA